MLSTVYFLILWLCAGFSWAGSAPQSVEVVTFHYPPYMMPGAQGEVVGILPEILEECLRGTNYKASYRVYPIKRAILEMHKIETWHNSLHLGTSLNFEDEILQKKVSYINFTIGKFVAYVSSEKPLKLPKSATIDALKPYQVAVLKGSVIIPHLRSEGIQMLEVSDLELLFKVLKMGRVDVAVILERSGEYFLHKSSGYNAVQISGILFEAPLSLMISKEHPQYEQLYQLITKNIKKFKAEGVIHRIETRTMNNN